jgi:hypothetical protein
VDKSGAWRVPPKFTELLIIGNFIVVPENDDWTRLGFLDKDGTRLGGGEYQFNSDEFQVGEGLFAVMSGDAYGYVDRTGTLVIPAEYEEAWAFSDGLAVVQKGGRHFYIDKAGKTAVEPKEAFDYLTDFDGDLAVAGKADKYGLIDKSGAVVLAPQYDWLESTGGVIVATKGEKVGIIDRSGAWIAEPAFDAVGVFSGGLAPARSGDKWGFIDTCGIWKIEPEYDDAFGFESGPAQVAKGDKWGLIDKAGKEILAPSMDYISEQGWTDGVIAFSPDGALHGLLDMSGNVVMEPKYNSVEPLGGGVLLAYVGEESKLLNLDGTDIPIAPAP